MSNPEWYISNKDDPILDALGVYMGYSILFCHELTMVRQFLFDSISQQPMTSKVLLPIKKSRGFLTKVGIKFDNVQPGMTRDFTISFSEESDRDHAVSVLDGLTLNNEKIFSDFSISEIGFAILPIRTKFPKRSDTGCAGLLNCMDTFVFVALKNAKHCGKGYMFTNQDLKPLGCNDHLDIRDLHDIVLKVWDGGLEDTPRESSQIS